MPKVVYHDSDGVDKAVSLGAEPLLIGRATECQIQTQDAMVSRRHARIVWDGNYWIEDLGSSNGVYVGSEKVKRAPLRPGDLVTCGSLVLRLMPDTAVRPSGVRLPSTAPGMIPPPAAPPPPSGLAPPPAAPPPPSTLSPPARAAAPLPVTIPPPSRSAPAEIKVGPNAVLRGSSATAMAGGAAASEATGELEREKRRRAELEEALLGAAARTKAAEARVAELEEPAREAVALRRKVDQLTADLRRLRGGRPAEEEHTSDEGERQARLAAEAERDQLRKTVAELRASLRGAAAPAAGAPAGVDAACADAAILLSDSLAELRASLRAALDEAGLLTAPSESVQVVSDALRSASEQLEAARTNLRALAKLLGV